MVWGQNLQPGLHNICLQHQHVQDGKEKISWKANKHFFLNWTWNWCLESKFSVPWDIFRMLHHLKMSKRLDIFFFPFILFSVEFSRFEYFGNGFVWFLLSYVHYHWSGICLCWMFCVRRMIKYMANMLIQYDLGTSGPIKKSLFHFAGGLPKTLHYIAMQSVHMYFQMILDRLQLGISHPWTKSLVSPKRALPLSNANTNSKFVWRQSSKSTKYR